MLNNLRLSAKFNLLLLAAFLICIIFSGVTLSVILNRNTESQTVSKAQIMLQTMNSIRNYTSTQVGPQLAPRIEQEAEFLPQTVPGYSAREVFEHFRTQKEYADFFYKEATLNPTNLRDQADGFETELVQRFRNDTNTKELTGFRSFTGGDLFYIARPISVSKESCLRCHSTPEAAPKSMLATYGRDNGFGWKLNEIVGAQIISVPSQDVINSGRQILLFVMLAVCGMFAIAILVVNLFLRFTVIKPLNQMAQVAHDVSIGKMDTEFKQTSHDEIGVLANAFNRMKLSLSMAMEMLNNPE
ncbi:MAG: histidine kinase [Pseudanabaena sp.]|nr:MAG: histidine kinase [Pseudanabaena sp.]